MANDLQYSPEERAQGIVDAVQGETGIVLSLTIKPNGCSVAVRWDNRNNPDSNVPGSFLTVCECNTPENRQRGLHRSVAAGWQ